MNLLLALILTIGTAHAKVHLSTQEALALAFPGCAVEERTAYLTNEQREAAAALAQAPVESALVRQYVGRCGGVVAGTAYFDTHRVRTLPETLMVVVAPDGTLARVEVLSFQEPKEYLPPAGFYGQLIGKDLADDLRFSGTSLRRVTGATLSCDATLHATRRTLALHRVLQGGA